MLNRHAMIIFPKIFKCAIYSVFPFLNRFQGKSASSFEKSALIEGVACLRVYCTGTEADKGSGCWNVLSGFDWRGIKRLRLKTQQPFRVRFRFDGIRPKVSVFCFQCMSGESSSLRNLWHLVMRTLMACVTRTSGGKMPVDSTVTVKEKKIDSPF